MKYRFISQQQNHRLILVYAGWACDFRLFEGLSRPGYDIAVIWDYRDFHLDWNFTTRYDEIFIIAWSLGVFAASVTAQAIERHTTGRIAINGTLFPVDNRLGIPEKIFRGTADGLDERNLTKFYRRICGSRQAYEAFDAHRPHRQVEELIEELNGFMEENVFLPEPFHRWDLAIISRDDAIFPAPNQWRAWQDVPCTIVEGAHLPDFQKIIDKYVIDKDHTQRRFERGLKTYDAEADVQAGVVDRFLWLIRHTDIASLLKCPGVRILEIGSGTGALSYPINRLCDTNAYFEMWDLAGDAPFESALRKFRSVDAEMEIMRTPSASFDIILSASTMQWFNSPSRFLEECARVCAPGAYILLSTFIKGNLWQVSNATGRALPLLKSSDWKKIIPERLELVEDFEFTKELAFDSAVDAFRHLRNTGVDSLGRTASGKPTLQAVRTFVPDLDGVYRITYRPYILLLRKRK